MRLSLLAALFLCTFAYIHAIPSTRAHPHVWVTVETEVLFGPDKEITGFKHKWTFDEFYTEFAIQGLDTNNDGVYSEEELKPLAQTNVEALKEFNYFTFPTVSDRKVPLKEPTDYRLEYKNKLLTLYFTLPLEAPVPAKDIKNFSFMVYDPGFYVALAFDQRNPIKLTSRGPLNCVARIGDKPVGGEVPLSQSVGENIDPASNFGSRFAQKVTVDCKP
jgi:ABC-type uncharacterized transport system substrate-binding protein